MRILLLAVVVQAQKQASCTFINFGLAVNIPDLGPGFILPAGINDWGTIVGLATTRNENEGQVALSDGQMADLAFR